ncbi:hypothetical protein HOLleu_19402 [Holothuria leucospilota]|uniref:Uncharacterized protein n=1 Tax=Holothuria leucospilota TaxID=206669 RepID=A0A9Q1C006_HOLLE|nr:hypothetical protein HOLleu_19402 [Holothuria leucospilota]
MMYILPLLVASLSMVICANSLQCFLRHEVDCLPEGHACDHIERVNDPMKPETCSIGFNRCYNLNYELSILDITESTTVGGCFSTIDSDQTGYFNRAQIDSTFPSVAGVLTKVEKEIHELDKVELCVCKDNLCNGGMNFAMSWSVIATTLMLSACVMYNYI